MAVLTAFTASPAFADALDHLAEGAPLYISARPVALIGALQRAGIADLPAMRELRAKMGGIDPFNPAILAAPGIDVAAPLALSAFESAGQGKLYHHRLAATLRDPATFTTFVSAVAASGQLRDLQKIDPASPLGKKGVVAMAHPSAELSVVVRLVGSEVVIDALQAEAADAKTPAPQQVMAQYPLKPGKPFTVGKGARRLFSPESAAVVYLDGRRTPAFMAAVRADDERVKLKMYDAAEKAQVAAEDRKLAQRCDKLWDHAPTTFDDLALALSAAPEKIGVTLAWGTLSGVPLGGLKLAPVDDGGVDAVELGHDAAAVAALYAASLQPFMSLKHTGPFASSDAFTAALKGCENQAGVALAVRSWPLAFGAIAEQPPQQAATIKPILSALRTVTLALRELPVAGARPHFAVAATFDGSARALVDAALAAMPGVGAAADQTFGKRQASVRALALPGFGTASAGLAALPDGKFELAVTDSDGTLGWAYRAGDAAASRPPVARVAADLVAIARWASDVHVFSQAQGEFLARLRRVDGELVQDGDMFRLDLRAPLPR